MSVLVVLLLLLLDVSGQEAYNRIDNKFVLDLSVYLETTFCVFLRQVGSPLPYVHLNQSYPAKNSVLTSVMEFEQLEQHVKQRTAGHKYGGTTLVVLKFSEYIIDSLREASHRVAMSAVKWVILAEEETPFATNSLGDTYIPFDCEFISVNKRGNLYLMTEIYQIAKGKKFETFNLGYWSNQNGISVTNKTFYNRRNNLKDHTFKALIGHNPPYTYVNPDAFGRISFGGYFYEVWKELEFRLQFRTEFPPLYINRDPKEVLPADNGISFSVTPITQDQMMARYMDLSEPIYDARVYLFGQRPGSELEWNSYLKPFSSTTWFVNLGWMIGSAIALAVLYKVAWHFNTSEAEADYYVFTLGECLATTFKAMCMQGSDVTPKSNSCRLLFLSIYMTALVVTSAFSAALFSLLTIPVSRAPFNTFEEVLATSGYRMGIIENSDIHKGLQYLSSRFPGTVHDKLNRVLERNKLPRTVTEGLQEICKGPGNRYIFIWDLPNVLDELQNMTRECQNLVMPAGPMLFREHMGFGYEEFSPYSKLLDLHLLRMKNEGILKRLLLNYWPPHIPQVQTSWVRVTVADISPILYLYTMGLAAGIIILMLEKLKQRWSVRQATSKHSHLGLVQPAATDESTYSKVEDWQAKYLDWDTNANYDKRM